jgi:acetyl-CoA carboxylase biotin carboxyl carrier protein
VTGYTPRDPVHMIDLRYVKKLIELLDASSVDSIEISTDKGMKIRLAKTPAGRAVAVTPVAAQLAVSSTSGETGPSSAPPAPPSANPPVQAEAPASSAAPQVKLLEIKSPMVGTFYSAPEPGTKPYVAKGDRVKKGQVICIIEAMKIMNEIESEFDGVVREVLADNAHPVEYGQVLFRIDPNG